MEKLIIENRTEMSMEDALVYAGHVIRMGKVSETSKGKQYRLISVWGGDIIIYADKNKNSDKLTICKEFRL